MLEIHVSGMTCGHCEAAVARAVRSVDPAAVVDVDRKSGRVSINTSADLPALKAVIESEGYRVDGPGA